MELTLEQTQTTSSGWIRALCPRCRNPKRKFYLNPKTGFFNCFHCGFRSNGFKPRFRFIDKPQKKKRFEFRLDRDVLPDTGGASAYLLSRGVDPKWVREYLRGVWVKRPYAVISDGFCHFLRALDKDLTPKYLTFGQAKERLFNEERAFASDSTTVFVFEGVFDVLCTNPDFAVASSGKIVTRDQAFRLKFLEFSSGKQVHFVFDSDVTPEQVSFLLEYFPAERIWKVSKDDPGDLGLDFINFLEPLF